MGICVSSVFNIFFSSFPSMENPSTSAPRGHPENAFSGIAAEASSASTKKGRWDVFINHRGCDVKHKLASTIYHTLDLLGLRPFLDENELDFGDSIPDEIQDAMRSAGLHIAIFSERYAESPWCLAELAFMVRSGTKILPVFYHVKPDDLRSVAQEKGCYAPAFSQHKKKRKYSSAMLDDWKSALQKVSYLSGYMLDSHNDDEGKLLKSIVNSVLGTMKKVPLEVAKHPVAMDEIVERFERSIKSQGKQHAQIVGILGFGGSGKTTLATELYNRKCSSFNRSCFLHDVRDAASKNALHAKQKRLLEDLRIQNDKSFDNYKEGKAILGDRLKSVCSLVVLDDVDHEDQVDALLPPLESLGSGSLIIVTTREGRVLTKCGITSIYRIQPLQHLHAKQLFCWHAFLQPSPQEDFHELVELFLGACSGLPLSLKVIGGQLYGRKSMEYWYAQLNKIRKALPEDIKAILKVSFDALDPDEQNVFLDIACFFIGQETGSAIHVWDGSGSGWSGLCSLETLVNKCLVEVDKEGRMKMHDHLRDLGRGIATTRSPSRFWFDRHSVVHIQREMPIRGIMAAATVGRWGSFNRLDLTPPFKEYMEMMRNSNLRDGLQLLAVAGNDFTQECGELSRGLLWLRWFEFPHRNIPSWLSLENTRVLDIFNARNLEALWDDARPPLQLRELLIYSGHELQSLPRSIEHLKHLKSLSLNCTMSFSSNRLVGLPEEFCRLKSLEHLILQRCVHLSSLPNRFGDLLNLRHLDLRGCLNLKMLPESFKQLIRLEYLNLSYCMELPIESDILENMENIKVFDVSGCIKLETLPHKITNQASLVELKLCGTKGLRELPASIDRLRKLEEVEIFGLPLLKTLPISFGNLSSLVTLTLEHCEQLYEMPSLGGLVSLVTLTIDSCPELYEMQSLEGLVSLQTLHVKECNKLKKIEGLEHLTSLEDLRLWTNWISPGMHSLRGLEGLRRLNLRAENISAFEACIQSIQMEKYSPWEMTLRGRITFPRVHSILDSFTFPGLVIVEADKDEYYNIYRYPCLRWSLTWRELKLHHAAIVCYVVRKESSVAIRGRESTLVDLSGGEWIVISVLTEVSSLINDAGHCLHVYSADAAELYDGWLIVGEMGNVIEGFKQLFQTLL